MTRDTYDKATVALDKVLKLKALKDKIKREIPELGFDKQLSDGIGKKIFGMLDDEIAYEQKEFDSL